MKQVKLILTGVDFLLPKDESNIHYLGPWCFVNNSRFRIWEDHPQNLIPSPYRTPESLSQRTAEVMILLPKIFAALTQFMNQATGQNRSVSYWQTILHSWTLEFICILYDRYLYLKEAQTFLQGNKVKVDICLQEPKRAENYLEYHRKVVNHQFNLYLFSDILRYLRIPDWQLEPVAQFDERNYQEFQFARGSQTSLGEESHLSFLKGLRDSLRQIAKSLDPAPQLRLGHVVGAEKSLLRRMKWKMGLPSVEWVPPETKVELDYFTPPESSELFFDAGSEFEIYVKGNLGKFVPTCYFSIAKTPINSSAKYYLGNEIVEFPDSLRIAEIKDKGGKWYSPQHGGSYGMAKGMPMGVIEYQFADVFLSWGWTHCHEYPAKKVIPLPSAHLSELKKNIIPSQSSERIVYVTTSNPAYTYRYDTAAIPDMRQRYFANMKSFFDFLAPELKENIWIKTYHHDWLLSEKDFFSRIHRADRLISNVSLIKIYPDVGLIINDNLITSFLESMAVNIPTLLVIDERIFPVIDEVKGSFEELKKAGIYHNSIEQGARFLNEIGGAYRSWWAEEKTQLARENFCRRFALTDMNWQKAWIDFMKREFT